MTSGDQTPHDLDPAAGSGPGSGGTESSSTGSSRAGRRVPILVTVLLAIVALVAAGVFALGSWAESRLTTAIAEGTQCPRDSIGVSVSRLQVLRYFVLGEASKVEMGVADPRPGVRRIDLTVRGLKREGQGFSSDSGTATLALEPPSPISIANDRITIDVGIASADLAIDLQGNDLKFTVTSATVAGQQLTGDLAESALASIPIPSIDLTTLLPPGSTPKSAELRRGTLVLDVDLEPGTLQTVEAGEPLCTQDAAVQE